MHNSAERLQEAIEHSSEDRYPGHGFEGIRYILLRITDVMYRCLKEELIYFENCVDFTFLLCYSLYSEEKVFIKTNETSACNKTESLYMKHIFTSYEMSSPSLYYYTQLL